MLLGAGERCSVGGDVARAVVADDIYDLVDLDLVVHGLPVPPGSNLL
jgi:hypothetical protein